MKFGPILHNSWIAGRTDDEIVGFWEQDSSTYVIKVPPNLRYEIIQMQNKLANRYARIEKLKKQIRILETINEEIFDFDEPDEAIKL